MPVVIDSQRHGEKQGSVLSSTSTSTDAVASPAYSFSASITTSSQKNSVFLAGLFLIAVGLFIKRKASSSSSSRTKSGKFASPISRRNNLQTAAGIGTEAHQYAVEKDITYLGRYQDRTIIDNDKETSGIVSSPPKTSLTEDTIPAGKDTALEAISFAMLNPLAPPFTPSSSLEPRPALENKPSLHLQPQPGYTTTFFSDTNQNPDYTHSSSPISFVPSPAPTPPADDSQQQSNGPRRRSYTRTTTDGVSVTGEIVVAEGWRRHTKVFGGGVCLACVENERRVTA